MIEKLVDRWQDRYAERLLAQAKREINHPEPRMTLRLAVGWVLSLAFLATPFVVMTAGATLIAVSFPRVLPIIVGLILVGFGLTLLPPVPRNRDKTYRREDLPALFTLLDRIGEKLNTTAPDGVHVDCEINAYMGQFRSRRFGGPQEWVLGIGLPLWAALNHEERIALLAHEMAHKVNADPMRQGVFHRAASVLDNWHETFEMDAGDIYGGASFVQAVAAMIVRFLQRILTGFSFFESQRAEYRADAAAVRAAGRAPVVALLEKILCADLAQRSIVDLYPYKRDRGGRIFDHMGAAIAHADAETAARLKAEAAKTKRRVDNSHPPTAMRSAFAESVPQDSERRLDAATVDFDAIDRELGPIREEVGKTLMEDLYEAEINR